MTLTLTILNNGDRARQILLSGPEAVIGRKKGSTVRINAHEVSRQHCRLRITPALVSVRDLGSANGTFVNGKPITGERPLRPGDRLQVGRLQFLVEYQPSDEPLDVLPAEEDVLVGEEIVDTAEVIVVDVDPSADASSGMTRKSTQLKRSGARPAPAAAIEHLPVAEVDEPNPFADLNGHPPGPGRRSTH
jgi:pSer/pThr/pTyr-binding forkhead associated (FHA) protein